MCPVGMRPVQVGEIGAAAKRSLRSLAGSIREIPRGLKTCPLPMSNIFATRISYLIQTGSLAQDAENEARG